MTTTNDRQTVLDAIDNADLVAPEQVADKALEVLDAQGLDAALAEVRRAAEFDAAGGNASIL